jgi:drug/metabolite transporter (DMT)-like permease
VEPSAGQFDIVRRVSAARLQIVAAALLFSTGGAAIKSTSFTGFSGGIATACLRSGVAALAIALFLPRSRRNWSWRTLVVGATLAVTLILFVAANKLTTSANTIFLQSTAPLWIAVSAPFLLRERVNRLDVAFMAVLGAGLALFFVDSPSAIKTAPEPVLGNVLAVISGVGWAGTVMGLRWLGRREGADSAAAATVAGNLITFLVCLPLAVGPATDAVAEDWLLIAYLGIVQIALAYVFVTRAMPHLRALEVSLLLVVEPALNPIWSWLVHGETVEALSIAGGIVILGATAAKTWWDSRNGRVLMEPG